ncbi:hypothetical protein PLICRDRAFT_159910 [Plicaturopsis crispa FD-325 SS-3]|nr:hypothetical protein PLICRDRAFT_159910 [Plicaturopsis crispa FD-325 SS-3]
MTIPSLPVPTDAPSRLTTAVLPPTEKTPSYLITAANKSYKHQYANIYFLRLRILREFVEERARRLWKGVAGNPVLIPRVLEVVKSQLCYIVGTVYMDMPLKPNVLEDIARDRSIPAPAPLKKFNSEEDSVMLEDESGRIRLVGERVHDARLVTGIIAGALGMETPSGDFEVVDICYAGLPPQLPQENSDESMDVDDGPSAPADEWVAVLSGLDVGSPSPPDAQIQMLIEYLCGEAGGTEDQAVVSQVSRLIIAGNSLAPATVIDNFSAVQNTSEDKKPRRYGYDSTTFSAHPTISLSAHLLDIARAMPIHILPGANDPSGTILPQQPFPRAMFGAAAKYASFECETNPTYIRLSSAPPASSDTPPSRPVVSRTILANSGQPLNDMYKYLPSPPTTRLALAESTLRWRHVAPTAPDTLWCHPYFTEDPFIIHETPDIYVIGGQPQFQTKLVEEEGKRCRIVLVPSFAETGVLVLVNLRTLGVRSVSFAVEGMTAGGGTDP